MLNGTPHNYEHWLAKTLEQTVNTHPNEDNLVFINAWNEWAGRVSLGTRQAFQAGIS